MHVLPKTRNGVVVGLKVAEQPHQFDVAGALRLKLPGGAYSVHVPIDINLQQIGGIVWRAALVRQWGRSSALQGRASRRNVDRTHGIFLPDHIIEAGGLQGKLGAGLLFEGIPYFKFGNILVASGRNALRRCQ